MPGPRPIPCRSLERRPENNETTRFLNDDERRRLLDACRASPWPRLYLLVIAALTTGARKGELIGLKWGDVDLQRAEAHVGRTKNGDPRVLPLVPAVVAELVPLQGKAGEHVFPSKRTGCGHPSAGLLPGPSLRRIAMHTTDTHEPAGALAGWVPLPEYQQQREPIMPSLESARWQCRPHRAALLDAGAIAYIAGRVWVHPAKADACLLSAGQEAARRRAVAA